MQHRSPALIADLLVNALFVSAGLRLPEETIETTSLPMITQLLAQSDMVVALPREVVRTHVELRQLVALPVDLELRLSPYGIVTRRQHALSPGAAAMLRALRKAAAAAKHGSEAPAVPALARVFHLPRFDRPAHGHPERGA